MDTLRLTRLGKRGLGGGREFLALTAEGIVTLQIASNGMA
jgi:hypothetical protein